MSGESEKELEQLHKLDKLRKLVQTILGTHRFLLIVCFVLILVAILTFVIMSVSYSTSRYLARVNLCYLPKQKGKIAQYDEKYVLGILKRETTQRNFHLHMSSRNGDKDEWKQDTCRILIGRDRKLPNNFSIQLNAASESEAVELINEFAQICIQEYTRERTNDLLKWKDVLECEHKDLNGKIQNCSTQIAKLTVPLQIISLEKDYERLRLRMNDLQSSRNRLNVTLDNLTRRKKQLEEELASVNPALLQYQHEIKGLQTELEKLNDEISAASGVYTDENPKMIAITSRRDAAQKRLEAFLKEKGGISADVGLVEKAEKQNSELQALLAELDAKQGEMRLLDEELSGCRKRFQMLSEYQPKLQRLTQEQRTLQESLSRVDESISEINYMLLMVKDDLFINEKASSAVGDPPMSKKKLAVCIFAALAITAFLAAVTVLIEFFFGHVANAQELKLYDEFHYLGVLPVSEELFNSEGWEKMAFNKIFHNFQALDLHVIFTFALPGAKIIDQMFDFFEWNFAMSGHKMLLVDVVLAEEFNEPADPGGETMILTFSGGKCYLPLASKRYLTPSELELLKNDFQMLTKNYDYVFLRHAFAVRRSILLLEQIAGVCDGMLAAVGAGRTPRKGLRQLLSVHLRIGLPVMTILTDHFKKDLNRDLNQEAES